MRYYGRWSCSVTRVSIICILETNVNNFSEEQKSYIDLKTEAKGDDIIEEIEDNTIIKTSIQNKSLKGRAENLKKTFKYALKEANDKKIQRKSKRTKCLIWKKCTDKTIIKLATLKSSVCLNIWKLRKGYKWFIKYNGTTKTI